MTPQELKNSILQLAIQGKLVEQRPEEGTAQDLYQHCLSEKKRIKTEEILKGKKKIVLQIIDENSLPYELPDNWIWTRLGTLVEIFGRIGFRGYTKEDIVDKGNGAITISPSNIDQSGKTLFEECTYLSWAKYEESPEIKIFNGDIIIVKTGSSYGKCGIVKNLSEKATINPQLAVLKYISCNVEYLDFALKSPMARAQYEQFVIGTSIPTFSQEKLANMLIPLPPLEEQKRIVSKIEKLLPLIDRYEQAWSRLEDFNKSFPGDMQKSILQMAIQGKLVEQRPEEGTGEELYQQIQLEKQALIKAGKIKKEKPLPEIAEDEIPFEIPESWKWVRIASIATLNPKNEISDDTETGFIPMPCVADGYRNEHTYETRKWGEIKKGFTHFSNGDIGIAKITPCFQNRKSVIFRNLPNSYGAGTTELSIVRVPDSLMLREYLLWFFKSEYFISNGKKSFTGTAGQQRIHKDYLAMCTLPLPPLDEQKRIVAKLEELLPLCEKLKEV